MTPVATPSSRGYRPRCVLLSCNHFDGAWREIALGLQTWSNAHDPWHILAIREPRADDPSQDFAHADGIIAGEPETRTGRLRFAQEARVPVVVIGDAPDFDFPTVRQDDDAIGRMAAEFFRRRGLVSLAYAGVPDVPLSRALEAAYTHDAQEHRMTCQSFQGNVFSAVLGYQTEREHLKAWLDSLPRPTGIFTFISGASHALLHFCHQIGIGVPEELAILGVDVDVPERALSSPSLAAVDQAPRRMGYEAARLLTHLMNRGSAPSEPIVVPPLQVVPGGSADLLVCSTPWVAKAMRYILQNVESPITVEDVAGHVKKSRRSLELAFKRDLSRTVAQEITHARIEEAKRLLARTSLTMPDIAVRCGFEWATSLTHCFNRVTGKTPNQYRHDHGTP